MCNACVEDTDCGGDAVCVDFGDGGVCTYDCADAACPDTTTCFDVPANGGTRSLCLNDDAGSAGVCAEAWVCGGEPIECSYVVTSGDRPADTLALFGDGAVTAGLPLLLADGTVVTIDDAGAYRAALLAQVTQMCRLRGITIDVFPIGADDDGHVLLNALAYHNNGMLDYAMPSEPE